MIRYATILSIVLGFATAFAGDAVAGGRCRNRVVYVYVVPQPAAISVTPSHRQASEYYLYPPTTGRFYYPSIFSPDRPRVWQPGDPSPGLTHTNE